MRHPRTTTRTFGYRFIADELARARHHRRARTGSPGCARQQRIWSVHRQQARAEPQARPAGARRPGRARLHRRPAPNQLWLTDITEHPTGEGKLYLCAIKDACSSRIVGYSMDSADESGPRCIGAA